MATRLLAGAMSLGGIGLLLAATAGMAIASAAPALTVDGCGYPNASSARAATVFNESTVTRAVQVYGVGSTARIAVFSNDENGVTLGVNGATKYSGISHVSNPVLGDTSAAGYDSAGRPQYPALFITNITASAGATSGDWQQGGAPTGFVNDVFGTWVTASQTGGQYQRDSLPAKNNWVLGAGSDTPTAGFNALGNEGYGAEFSWNVSALGLKPGNTYRVQVMTHDGDQNRSGGDVGEVCTNLTIPGTPATPAVTVVKSNNASGQGFARSSTAPVAGAAVPFQLVVTNTSAESEKVTSLTDSYSGQTITPDCRTASGVAVLGSTLSPGQVVTCGFTLSGYAPPSGQSLTDLVVITVTDGTGQTATDNSTSTVNTPPVVLNQSIAGSIFLCDSGGRTATPVNGGSLAARSGSVTVVASPDQLPASSVPAGVYTLGASAPPGYQFVACGASGVTISGLTQASQTVTVPGGGSGSGVFYVTRIPLVAAIDKTNNADGTGGYTKSEMAGTVGQAVPFRAVITNSSVVPVVVTSLSDSWPSQAPFSPSCSQAVVGATLAPGASITCDFTLPNYAPPVGQFLEDTVTATLSQLDVASNSTVTSNSATVTSTSTVGTTQVLGEQITAPTTTPPAPVVSPAPQLAFTGPPAWTWKALEAGLALMSAGFFLLWLSRPRPAQA